MRRQGPSMTTQGPISALAFVSNPAHPSYVGELPLAETASLIASGKGAWNGILDDRAPGVCTTRFPIYKTSRIQAGGPITGNVFQCELQSVKRAVSKKLYGAWKPSSTELARLEQIFPTGVCDYTKRDRALPPELRGKKDDD